MNEGSIAIEVNLYIRGTGKMFSISCGPNTMGINLHFYPGPTRDKVETVLREVDPAGHWSATAKEICTKMQSCIGIQHKIDEDYYKHVAQLIRAMVYATP